MILPTIGFATNAKEILPESGALLDAVARNMIAYPDELGVVAVVGHAAKGEERPDPLAAERADTVTMALRARGIAATRLLPYSFGAYCPVDASAPDKNRRVEFARPSANPLGCDAARMLPVAKNSRRAGAAKPLDTSDWTQADADLALTWTVDQSKANPPVRDDVEQDRTKSDVPLDLTMSLAGKTHSLDLHANAGVTGTPTCSSILFFWAGWLLRFRLQRLADQRVLLTRIAGGEATADVTTPLFVFAVPSGARVHQTLVTIAPNGMRSQEECIGPAGP